MPRILKTRRLKVTKNKTRSSKKGGARRALDNKSIRNAVKDYLEGGSEKDYVIYEYGEIEDWDTSKVTNMEMLFDNASDFNKDISNWDVSNVTNMEGMFYLATKFNQPIGRWGKKTSNVNNMKGIFAGAKSFNQPIGNWDVSNVTDMSSMFDKAIEFNQSIGDWNVSKVTNMSYMFADAESFNRPINRWDVSKVVNIKHMFSRVLGSSFSKKLTTWGDKLPTNTDFSLIFGSEIGDYIRLNSALTKSERKFLDKIAPWFFPKLPRYDYSIGIKKFAKRDEDDRECSICMDSIDPKDKKNIMITPCNHAYHKDCLKRWMKDRSSCPDCRRTLPEPK
jgi:surface protein